MNLASKLSPAPQVGDVAAVLYNGKLQFAVFADKGPTSKMGEGSVLLVQNLGFNPYKNGRICCGITSGVVTIVFPGTRGKYSSPYDASSVSAVGMAQLNQLTGQSSAVEDNSSTFVNESPSGDQMTPLAIGLIVGAVILVLAALAVMVGLLASKRAAELQNAQRP